MIREHVPVAELLLYGYENPVMLDASHASVARVGIIHPAILLENEAPYGPVIHDLRMKAGMEMDDFARRLMMGEKEVYEIENGQRSLSDHEMNLVANLFGVRSDALRHARVYHRRTSLEAEIQKTHALFDRLKEEIIEQIEQVDKACGNERFFVKPSSEDAFYLIYDAKANGFVPNEKGEAMRFTSPLAALDAAYRLEKGESIKIHPKEIQERVRIKETRQKFSCIKEGDKVYVYEGGAPDRDGADTLAAVYAADGKETVLTDLSDDTRQILEAEALRMLQPYDKTKEAEPLRL